MICKQCGACCKYVLITIHPFHIEDYRNNIKWLDYHGIEMIGDKLKIYEPCQYLNKNKCSIYDMRPQCCRDAQVGTIPECKGKQ